MSDNFEYGEVKIANDILDQITREAVLEVAGVYVNDEGDLSQFSYKNPFKIETRVVNERIYVDLEINLKLGANIQKTVRKVQENVKRQLETMTGLEVSSVNVVVGKLLA